MISRRMLVAGAAVCGLALLFLLVRAAPEGVFENSRHHRGITAAQSSEAFTVNAAAHTANVMREQSNATRPSVIPGGTSEVTSERPLTDWQPPRARSSDERTAEREEMVRRQIESPGWTRDAVMDPAVLRAMRAVPRHVFLPREVEKQAYQDSPLPIGHGQTISQPYIVAAMTELLKLRPGSKVLEIGTGSGYQAAVLAELTPEVYTIEIIEPLARKAAQTLSREGYGSVRAKNGDGYFGWPEAAPFDAIIVTCAAGHLPPPLWEQIKPGGRIVIPIGGSFSVQRLVVIEKTEEGRRKTESVMSVRFVPMTGHTEGS